MSRDLASASFRRFPHWFLRGMVFCLLLAFAGLAQADPAGDIFLNAYLLREEGVKAEKSGDFKVAYDRFRAATRLYDQVARDFPDWKPAMVSYRRKSMADQIAAVADKAAKMDLGRPAGDSRPLPAGASPSSADAGDALPVQGARPPRNPEARPIAPSAGGIAIRPPVLAPATVEDPFASKRIAELEQRQAGAQKVLEQLGKERDALKARLAEVANSQLLADHEAKQFRQERDTLRQQLSELQEKGVNSSVQDKAKIAAMEKSLKTTEAKLADSEKAAAREQEQAMAEIAKNRQAMETAQTNAREANQRAAQTEKQLDEAWAGLKDLASAREAARQAASRSDQTGKDLAEARQQIAAMEQGMRNAANASGARAQQASDELASSKARLASLERELAAAVSAKDEAERMARDMATAQAGAKPAATPGPDATGKIEEALRARLAAMEADKSRADEAAAHGEQELANLKQQLAMAGETAKQLATTQTRLAEIEATLALATRDRDRLLAGLQAVTAERDQLRADRAHLAARLASMENYPAMVQANERLEAELADARRQLAELGNAREQDTTRIRDLRRRLEQVEGELAGVRKENAGYRDQMTKLEQRLAEARASLETATSATDPTLAEENKILKSIVVRQLRQQAYRARARALLLSELAKLEINSKAMLQYIDQLEGKDSLPGAEEIAHIDDNYIRALSGVELAGQFFTQDAAPPAVPGPPPGDAPRSDAPRSDAPAGPAAAAADPDPGAARSSPARESLPPGLAGDPDARDAFIFQKQSLATTAEGAFQKGNFVRAEETYRLIVDADPSDLRMQCNLGVSLLKQGKFPEASERFQEALRGNEANGFAHLMLGVCQWKLNKLNSAVDRFNRCLVLEPGNPQAWLYLGLVAIDRKKWQDAETAFKKALEIRPGYAPAAYNLALVYTKPGFADPIEARRCYELSLRSGGARDETLETFLRVGAARPSSQPPVLPHSADPVIAPGTVDEELPEL